MVSKGREVPVPDDGATRSGWVDASGREMPDPGWPIQGAAPGDLELVRRFANTSNSMTNADLLRSAIDLASWMTMECPSAGVTTSTSDSDLKRIHDLRRALRRLVGANRTETKVSAAEEFVAASREVHLVARLGDSTVGLGASDQQGVDHYMARMVSAVVVAHFDHTWERLVLCQNPRCRWMVYDSTRSRTKRWCSMDVCGSRSKSTEYRRRQRG
jgi:predicted RNA-binding Zn ribbon-like protein